MSNPAPGAQMSCSQLVELVTPYLEGMLGAAGTGVLQAHLGECEGCEAYLEQYRQTVCALGSLREGGVDPEVRRRLMGLFEDLRGFDR